MGRIKRNRDPYEELVVLHRKMKDAKVQFAAKIITYKHISKQHPEILAAWSIYIKAKDAWMDHSRIVKELLDSKQGLK